MKGAEIPFHLTVNHMKIEKHFAQIVVRRYQSRRKQFGWLIKKTLFEKAELENPKLRKHPLPEIADI